MIVVKLGRQRTLQDLKTTIEGLMKAYDDAKGWAWAGYNDDNLYIYKKNGEKVFRIDS